MLEGPYRVGPWPGLTPSGAGVLLGCAVLLAVGQLFVGSPQRPLPDLPVLGIAALLPVVIATRIAWTPGAASAVCGAYLMPRTLLSLAHPALELPPLLLVPSLAFDLALWLSASDLTRALQSWPRRPHPRWKRSPPTVRSPGRARAVLAGAAFGLVLSLVEPPYALLLGADSAAWSGIQLWLGGALTVIACAAVASLSARGTTS
jgi:hypothetical protein